MLIRRTRPVKSFFQSIGSLRYRFGANVFGITGNFLTGDSPSDYLTDEYGNYLTV